MRQRRERDIESLIITVRHDMHSGGTRDSFRRRLTPPPSVRKSRLLAAREMVSDQMYCTGTPNEQRTAVCVSDFRLAKYSIQSNVKCKRTVSNPYNYKLRFAVCAFPTCQGKHRMARYFSWLPCQRAQRHKCVSRVVRHASYIAPNCSSRRTGLFGKFPRYGCRVFRVGDRGTSARRLVGGKDRR